MRDMECEAQAGADRPRDSATILADGVKECGAASPALNGPPCRPGTHPLPDLAEERDRARRIAGVVVVEVAVNGDVRLQQFLDGGNPHLHFALAVDQDAVPVLGFFLDALAVAEPAHVGETGGVEMFCIFWKEVGGGRSPRIE